MTFSSPIWLWMLLPWAALAVWMLVGRRDRVFVPFARLWKGPIKPPRSQRRLQPPPLFIILLLLAALLACLAAAGPALPRDSAVVTVIVDRSLTMSARGDTGPRFGELLQRLGRELASRPDTRIRLIAVPEAPGTMSQPLLSPAELAKLADSLPPTLADTRQALRSAIRRALNEHAGNLLVLSDQVELPQEARLILLTPQQPWRNVGIEHLAWRPLPAGGPGGQVLLRLRNDSPLSTAEIELLGDGVSMLKQRLDLPPAGGRRDYFLDIAVSTTLEARLAAEDDLPADNRAFLARTASWPRLELHGQVRPELQRLVEQYARLRPPGESAARIAITSRAEALPADAPGIIVRDTDPPASAAPPKVTLADHPIFRSAGELPAALARAWNTTPPPDPAAWRALLWLDGVPALFIRESPVRQAWVGFAATDFPATAQFVVFWTNLLDWTGQGGADFTSRPLGALDDSLAPFPGVSHGQPGIYGDRTRPQAFNLPAVLPPAAPRPWPSEILATPTTRGSDRPLAAALLLGALALAMLSVFRWARANAASPNAS